jgi:hypothetical protein
LSTLTINLGMGTSWAWVWVCAVEKNEYKHSFLNAWPDGKWLWTEHVYVQPYATVFLVL